MLWRGRQGSGNVDDRRGLGRGGGLLTGGGIIGVIIYLVMQFMGVDPSALSGGDSRSAADRAGDDTLSEYVSVVLRETETVWHKLFEEQGITYQEPTLVIFRGNVQSVCGYASSTSGPFYCPADHKVYIDLAFYTDLRERFGGGGDFAMAYVIAHEVGHHVQTLLGLSEKMEDLRGRVDEETYNRYSVAMELQADFYAGVWAHYSRGILEAGDIEEALSAANAIGDDRLQQQSQGHVAPETFTHGTSQQRMMWFKKGFDTGDLRQGNTFEGMRL